MGKLAGLDYTSSVANQSKDSRVLGIVFLTIFLDLVGFGIIIPIQPFLAEKLGASPKVVTLLGASFSLMQFLFAPFWGRLSDRIGRRPVMLSSIFFTAIGYTLFGFADSLWLLFAARMLAGFGSANIGTAQAMIADSTKAENRAKGMGLVGAAFGLGFIFGPPIGGGFAQLSLSAPAYFAGGLSFFNLILAYFRLPETRSAGAIRKNSHASFSLAALKHAARHKNVARLFVIYGVYFTAFALMEQVLGLFIEHYWVKSILNITAEAHAKQAAGMTAQVLIVVGVMAAVVQGGLIGKLATRFGEIRLLTVGIFITCLVHTTYPFVGMYGQYFWMFFMSGFMAIGSGLTHPSLSSLISKYVDDDERGGALGLGQSLASLGRVAGPSIAGFLFEIHPGAPFWAAGILTLFCTWVALGLKR